MNELYLCIFQCRNYKALSRIRKLMVDDYINNFSYVNLWYCPMKHELSWLHLKFRNPFQYLDNMYSNRAKLNGAVKSTILETYVLQFI